MASVSGVDRTSQVSRARIEALDGKYQKARILRALTFDAAIAEQRLRLAAGEQHLSSSFF